MSLMPLQSSLPTTDTLVKRTPPHNGYPIRTTVAPTLGAIHQRTILPLTDTAGLLRAKVEFRPLFLVVFVHWSHKYPVNLALRQTVSVRSGWSRTCWAIIYQLDHEYLNLHSIILDLSVTHNPVHSAFRHDHSQAPPNVLRRKRRAAKRRYQLPMRKVF
jgi:hypothetical protein